MIMINETNCTNYTTKATPAWMTADNYAELLKAESKKTTFISRLFGRKVK